MGGFAVRSNVCHQPRNLLVGLPEQAAGVVDTVSPIGRNGRQILPNPKSLPKNPSHSGYGVSAQPRKTSCLDRRLNTNGNSNNMTMRVRVRWALGGGRNGPTVCRFAGARKTGVHGKTLTIMVTGDFGLNIRNQFPDSLEDHDGVFLRRHPPEVPP